MIKTIQLRAFLIVIILNAACNTVEKENEKIEWTEKIQIILDNTEPLEYERESRLPLYLWPAIDPGELNDKAAETLVKELNKRGIGLVSSWNQKMDEKDIQQNITIAKVQERLGLRVNINATSLLYGFYNGDKNQAHIDKNDNLFFDKSFGNNHDMGCPFTLDSRKKIIRDRIEYFLKRYKAENLSVNFIFADWEIDGPIEVNDAYESSLRCTRCQEYLGEDFGFDEFQKVMREMRSFLQNYTFSAPVLSSFPDALVGNYAVYPNNGYRYWYDYFEHVDDNHPHISEQKATYRKWYDEFSITVYSCAMPVVYPWGEIYTWYDFKNTDYRWFYNMLLVASNAGKSTPHSIPIVSFVHWNTVLIGPQTDPDISQMSKNTYQELLWHMLLRGTDTFFMWCSKEQYAEETKLVQEVYAAAQKYGKFLEHGVPVTFDVPEMPGSVISGLALKDSVLIRRTDFDKNHEPVQVLVGTKRITVKYGPGTCKVMALN